MDVHELIGRIFLAGNGEEARFVALGSNQGLRWILPVGQPKIDHLLRSWRPYGRLSLLGWQIISRCARSGVLGILPGARSIQANISGTSWHEFGWQLEAPPAVVIYVGTKGPSQKAVLMLVDPVSGLPQMVVKFPLGVCAWTAIAREHRTLGLLQESGRVSAPLPGILREDARFAAQGWLEGKPVDTPITAAHLAYLGALVTSDRTLRLEDVRDSLMAKLQRAVAQGGLEPNVMAEVSHLVDAGRGPGEVPTVRVHGDFAPWNLKYLPDRSIAAVDWEESREEGLPFYDLHYYVARVHRLLGRKVEVSWDAYEELICSPRKRDRPALRCAFHLARAQALLAQSGVLVDDD